MICWSDRFQYHGKTCQTCHFLSLFAVSIFLCGGRLHDLPIHSPKMSTSPVLNRKVWLEFTQIYPTCASTNVGRRSIHLFFELAKNWMYGTSTIQNTFGKLHIFFHQKTGAYFFLAGDFKHSLIIFMPIWGNDPIWLIFSDGLKPPASFIAPLFQFFFWVLLEPRTFLSTVSLPLFCGTGGVKPKSRWRRISGTKRGELVEGEHLGVLDYFGAMDFYWLTWSWHILA